jgi:cytochrome c oxidase cbb3-type subunit III
MSDFVNDFWAWYVGAISIISVLACAFLLWIAGQAKVENHGQEPTDNTTGHVWDQDLRELNNPLPRWWMWLFIITVIFGLVYLALYPGLGRYAGLFDWSMEREHKKDISTLRERIAPIYATYAATPIQALSKNTGAMAIGERLFMNNCSQCHGSDGRGSASYPNLANANAAWLGEKDEQHIVQTVTNGRIGMMPPMGAAIGNDQEINSLAHYVLSLSGSVHDRAKAISAKEKYATCAACHGIDGKGIKALGAPNLTDNYWLHGSGEAAIVAMIKNGKNNVMPPQNRLLTPQQIHVVSAYVLSLSAKQ